MFTWFPKEGRFINLLNVNLFEMSLSRHILMYLRSWKLPNLLMQESEHLIYVRNSALPKSMRRGGGTRTITR